MLKSLLKIGIVLGLMVSSLSAANEFKYEGSATETMYGCKTKNDLSNFQIVLKSNDVKNYQRMLRDGICSVIYKGDYMYFTESAFESGTKKISKTKNISKVKYLGKILFTDTSYIKY